MGTIDDAYKRLKKCRVVAKEKGDAGEEILLSIAQSFQEDVDCIILWSYTYPYMSNRKKELYPGNIKFDGSGFIELTKDGYNDEIDLLIITDYRIFVIECKARSGRWLIYDHWTKQNGKNSDKSPITQCEKHARHFYHLVHEVLPENKSDYIIPLTIFVDKAVVADKRTQHFKSYIPAGIANNFKKSLYTLNTPLDYRLDIEGLMRLLSKKGTSRSVFR